VRGCSRNWPTPSTRRRNWRKQIGVCNIQVKTSLGLTGDENSSVSFTATLDSLSLFDSDSGIKGDKILIFDDLERSLIEIKELLGFINYLVEHSGCHAVIVCNEKKLSSVDELKEFKEKVIGRTFEIKANAESALESFICNMNACHEYWHVNKNLIAETFRCSGTNNLRVLRQCLYDFGMQISPFYGKSMYENAFLHNLLCSFVAVYAEINTDSNREAILHWRDTVNQNSDLYRDICKKYVSVSKQCMYHVMYPDLVVKVVEHIYTGRPLADFIRENMDLKPNEKSVWQKLGDFSKMSNADFDKVYDESKEALLQNEIKSVYDAASVIAYLELFDSEGICKLSKDDEKQVNSYMGLLLEEQTDVESLYKVRNTFISAYNYVWQNNPDSKKSSVFSKYFNDTFDRKSEVLPDKIQKILWSLNDKNVLDLKNVDEEVLPDKSTQYSQIAIFRKENAQKMYERLKGMSNEGVSSFSDFLRWHYKLERYVLENDNRYKEDVEFLSSLKQIIDNELCNMIGVERYVYATLSDAIGKSISACGGRIEIPLL
jgi:hypothetical protein